MVQTTHTHTHTLYFIYYLCYGHYLTASFLALKGFQDSNLPSACT